MNQWRMAFKQGSQGNDCWPECKKAGVAALGYWTNEGDLVVKDCSKITEDKYDQIWRQQLPSETSSRSSLRNLAYRMKIGDIIYVKSGKQIVGKGIVKSGYMFDEFLEDKFQVPWPHYVKVQWDLGFKPINILLGAEQHTLLLLNQDRIAMLDKKVDSTKAQSTQQSNSLPEEVPAAYTEGNSVTVQINRYEREPRARSACLRHYGYFCSACGISIREAYGTNTEIVHVHHLVPLSTVKKEYNLNPIEDLRPVCPNCHAVIHSSSPALTIEEIKLQCAAKSQHNKRLSQ
jgi:hypothetical protein